MKKIFIKLLIILILFIIFLFYNTRLFKIYNLEDVTNKYNENMPYIEYNFEKVDIYKWINNNYILWNVEWKTSKNKISNNFTIQEAYNIENGNYLYYQDFNKNKIEIFWYMLLFFSKPHLREDKVMVYKDKNNIYIWLWNINDFLDNYLSDFNYPKNRKYDDIKENLDYIPHIIFPIK